MRLEQADLLAAKVVVAIDELCEKIQVVGSLRRRRSVVHDIDLVVIPKQLLGAWQLIANRLHARLKMQKVKMGPKLMTYKFEGRTFTVDVYRATRKTWGVLQLIRTGSTQHNIKMCNHARSLGMMLSAADGVIKDGEVIASRTEEDIFEALNMPFVEPEKREV
jgi:DNA polymerase (family 10)